MLASLKEEGPVAGQTIAAAPAEPLQAAAGEDLAPVNPPVDTARIRTLPIHITGKSPLLPFSAANAAAAEQYRIIRTRLLQHPRQPRSLLISSTGPGDGKSITAVNIAGALSLKSEARVLLTDVDFRRSVLDTRLGLPSSPGLGDILTGTATLEESLIQIEQLPNLYFLPVGTPQSNPSELLDSERWAWLCNCLRAEFRYIVADAPPVASVADYELLQASCDGVVMVIRPDHTRREAVLRTLKSIPKEKMIGVIMNDVQDWFFTRSTPYSSHHTYYERPSSADKNRVAAGK